LRSGAYKATVEQRSWRTRKKLSRSVADPEPHKSSNLPALFLFFVLVILVVFVVVIEVLVVEVFVIVFGRKQFVRHGASRQDVCRRRAKNYAVVSGFGCVFVTGAAAVAAAWPETAAAAGAWAVGAGVVAPGVAGGGVAGFAPGAAA